MIDKFVRSVAEALDGIKDGSTVLIAGFAQVGEPRALIDGLIDSGMDLSGTASEKDLRGRVARRLATPYR